MKTMRLQSSMITGARIATVCGLALAAGFFATRAKADDWDKKTVLTVNEPIQITDAYLQPGTYVLMLDRDSQSNRHIVRVFNDKQNHLITTILAMPAYRVRVTGNTQFTFWETPPGSARALRDWYWPGDNFGQEFPYPKNLKQTAQVSQAKANSAPAPAAPAPQAEEQPAPQAQAEVQPAPQPQAPEQEQPAVQEQQEVILAQAEPAPAPPAPEAQAQEQNQSQPQEQTESQPQEHTQSQSSQAQELPKTGSSYPLVGLVGLFSLGLYCLLRAKRLA
jgi:hypothetical protein